MIGHLYTLLLVGQAAATQPAAEEEAAIGSLMARPKTRRRIVSGWQLPDRLSPQQEEWARRLRRQRQLQTLRSLRVL